jgi:endonuclease/exonuclease/phosphatase family metal-dependent hydrolase
MDGIRSLDRTAETIKTVMPDIVCLQEVHVRFPQSGFQDQPAQLRQRLGMPVHFLPSFRVGFSAFGNLIATAFPLRTLKLHPITNASERRRPKMIFERRGLLEAVIDLPQGPWAVFITHWGLDEGDRLINAEETGERIKAVGLPTLLLGDFNARPDSDEIGLLKELSGLVDGGAGADVPTYPADTPRARIDYLFHSPETVVQQLTVIDTQVSDHWPLLAVF